jgi:hypothetical protein
MQAERTFADEFRRNGWNKHPDRCPSGFIWTNTMWTPWGGLFSPMPHSFPTSERRHKLWGGPQGGPPGPRPTPSSARLSCRKALIHRTQGRVRGDPRGAGGPPHYLCRIPVSRKVCGIVAIQPADPLSSGSSRLKRRLRPRLAGILSLDGDLGGGQCAGPLPSGDHVVSAGRDS